MQRKLRSSHFKPYGRILPLLLTISTHKSVNESFIACQSWVYVKPLIKAKKAFFQNKYVYRSTANISRNQRSDASLKICFVFLILNSHSCYSIKFDNKEIIENRTTEISSPQKEFHKSVEEFVKDYRKLNSTISEFQKYHSNDKLIKCRQKKLLSVDTYTSVLLR